MIWEIDAECFICEEAKTELYKVALHDYQFISYIDSSTTGSI